MKNQTILSAALIILFSAALTSVNAQVGSEPAVKILPSADKSIFKILFAYASEKSVDIKFFDENGSLGSDRINCKNFSQGFLKKYDLSNIKSKSFTVEIESENVDVVYKMIESKDRKTYVPQLERTTYKNSLVASNN